MRKRNFERVLRNTPGLSLLTEADRQNVSKIIAGIDEGLARSFPVRRLYPGECSCHRSRTQIVWWNRREWVAKTGKQMMLFLGEVRREVGSGALAFYLSPTMELMSGRQPVLWLSGYVIPRAVARLVGRSFNREVRTGRRSWWR